jgi:hypothetical protein
MPSESDFFKTTLKSNDNVNKAKQHASIRSGINDSESIDKDAGLDEDECNLINKEDFEEGKPKDIVTARATPIKSNALAKKNLSTARKMSHNMCSPQTYSSITQYQDPNNPTSNGVYI